MASETVKYKNNSERDFRWPDLEILAGDTVEIHKEQIERIKVLEKLVKQGDLEIVEDKKATEAEEEVKEDEEVKEVLKNIKGKKK